MINNITKLISLFFYLAALLIGCIIRMFSFEKGNFELDLENKKIAFFDTKIPSKSSAGERSFIELYNYLKKYSDLLFILKGNNSASAKSKDIDNDRLVNIANPVASRRLLKDVNYVVIMSPEAYLVFNVLSLLLFLNIKVIYYSTDIFSLRYRNEFEVTRSSSSLFYSYYYRLSEPLIWILSVFCLSNREDESRVIQRYNKNTSVIPTRVFFNLTKVDDGVFDKKISKKINFLFVGGIGNAPNISAVDFIMNELIPELDKGLSGDYVIHIVGSGWKKYLSDGVVNTSVVVHGVVSDEELDQLYDRCFFSLATLQYGAGVKGKVIEAMLNSLVVVTTPIGAEGIDCKTLRACSTAQCMVSECNAILADRDLWKLTVDGYIDYLHSQFGEDAMNKGLNI